MPQDDKQRDGVAPRDWTAYYEKLRGRPPRATALLALERSAPIPRGARAVDLGCGDGRDTIEFLHRGCRVMAVDAEPAALERLQARPDLPAGAEIEPVVSRFERVELPRDALLINSSFALPLCEPGDFHELWARIRDHLPSGGRFAGQFYGERDSWKGRPGMTFVTRTELDDLLRGLEVEMLEEEEADGVTPRGTPKHWHIFHIVVRKP